MIEELIKKTNTREFYQNCFLNLDSYSYQTSNNTFEMFLSISRNNDVFPIENEEWKLTCLKTECFDGFHWGTLLPYVKLKIMDKHPLLFKYHENEIEALIKGKPENVGEFIGNISNALENETGNWITVNQYFWNNEEYFKNYSERTISIPKSLEKPIREVCLKHQLQFQKSNEIVGTKKGYANKPNTKILIFGNEDISPNNFNLNQPYIIAEKFTAERIK